MPAETPPSGSEASARLAELKHTLSLGPDAAANAAQRLLGAVEAVLELHQPKAVTVRQPCDVHWKAHLTPPAEFDLCPCTKREQVTCAACDPICPDDNTWPCPTVQAITRELLGKET